ncbi:MAG: energy-coupling factor transporter transmembrane protein EcfT [Micromonosporaceae bacterium]|nr:energy-coupling factor transporter transmembrane protein EcfT [Micromonosporaceae bacterium]
MTAVGGAPSSLAPPGRRPVAVLAGRNPVAKLGAAFVVTFGLLVTLDPIAPAIALLVEVAVVPLFGISLLRLLRRSLPILLSAAGAAVVQLLFGTGDDPTVAAAGLGLRVLAIALPSVLAFTTIDPTDLADALVQQLRLPARFAIGALAALRLLPLLADDWRTMTFARRARGVWAGRNPVAQARLLTSTTFALLVAAIRRGTRLATAMDARGFAAGGPRSAARQQRFTIADAALIVAAAGVVAAALGASVATGAFRPLL